MSYERYPYVISNNYRLLVEEERGPDRLRQVIRTFASTLKFVALTSLAEYLSSTDRFTPKVDEFLANRNNIGRPSLGQFADLFRRLASGAPAWLPDSSLAGLTDIVSGKGKIKKRFAAAVDHLIHTRNLYVHSDIVPPDDELGRLLEENERRLHGMLDSLGWLADGELILVREDGSCLECRETVVPRDPVEGTTKPGVWWTHQGRSVFMPPFLVGKFVEGTGDNDVEQVLQYETLQGKNVKYLFGRHGLYVQREDLVAAVMETIRSAKTRLPESKAATEPLGGGEHQPANWSRIVDSAKARSKEIVELQVALGKYLRAAYARRSVIEESVTRFLESDKRLMIVVGESGCGKTNVLCRMTQDLLADRHAVLHYYGRRYQGGPLLRVVARDLVWDEAKLEAQLAACSKLPDVAGGKRLVVLLDAVNEYSRPGELFDEVLRFLQSDGVPSWIKVVLTCRPVPWEHIELGFQPNYQLIHASESPGRGERKPYFTLGPFTEEELGSAWAKWKVHKGLGEESELPTEATDLLRQPILFRFYVDALERGREGGSVPRTAEDILLLRYEGLGAQPRSHVTSVVSAMWRLGRDYMLSRDYVDDPHIEEWISCDVGDDEVGVFACSDEAHRVVQAQRREYEEHRLPADGCIVCGETLVRVGGRPIRHPLDFLRDEGVLSLYDLDDGDQLLRFTYDRMYETLTAQHVTSLIGRSENPGDMLVSLVDANVHADKAPVLGAIRTSVLMGLHAQPSEGTVRLRRLASETASVDRQDFLRGVLSEWARRDPSAAWATVTELVREALATWRNQQRIVCGLQAGITVLARLLADCPSVPPLAQGGPDAGRRLLVDAACDSKLAVVWDSAGLPPEVSRALANTPPNDLALNALFEVCATRSRDGHTEDALWVVREILSRIEGIWGLFRHRRRIRPILNWLTRLLTSEIRNEELVGGTLSACRSFFASLPFLGPRRGRVRRALRSMILRLVSVPVFAIANDRAARLMETIPAGSRRYPELPPPKLTRLLHLTAEKAPDYDRFVQLYRDLGSDFSDEDLDLVRKTVKTCADEPFAGLLRNLPGGTISLRSMQSFDWMLRTAQRYAESIDPDEELANIEGALMWGAFHHHAPLSEEQQSRIAAYTRLVLEKCRRYMLRRYEMAGSFGNSLNGFQLAEVFRKDGDMPSCAQLVQEAAARDDWALVARFWDRLVLSGLQRPKPVLGYVERVLDFDVRDGVRITCAPQPFELELEAVAKEAQGMEERYSSAYPGLDSEPHPRETALLHLLGTVATLELAHPREVEGFYRRKEIPPQWIALVRGLAHQRTMRTIRDERMLSYAVNYCALEFTKVRNLIVTVLGMIREDAAKRKFAEPTRKDLVRLLVRVLDRVLDEVHGAHPQVSVGEPG